eukprot:CAMPEP_0185762784 /NCGR_PEP_ID=MMETSP1174-20130828/21752_1 /TAXON_ID=35687 /ORGANISM="Dictyocha speculum, Strain CCMP1381" /LENGTH=142 /DNA_ID=CAMNT_0028444605 /DNA_START=17 /DNA_END=442 /DNA_ORIENTATION=+
MDYIRCARQQPGYSPETVHCICGEDADLIMLGLALHEEHVLILRKKMPWEAEQGDTKPEEPNHEDGEEGNKGENNPDAAPHGFFLLRISVLRAYLRESLCTPFLHVSEIKNASLESSPVIIAEKEGIDEILDDGDDRTESSP